MKLFERIGLSCGLAVLILSTMSLPTQAEILISNIEFSDYLPGDPSIATSLSFDLSGTIDDVITQDTQNTATLFVGEIATTGWINSYSGGSWSYNDSSTIPTVIDVIGSASSGDRVAIGMTGGYSFAHQPTALEVNSIDGTATITNGSFTPGATDTSNWVVSIGWNTFVFPDPETVTGAAVPEPASLAILMIGGMLVARTRRPHRAAVS